MKSQRRVGWRSIQASPYYRPLKTTISHHRQHKSVQCCPMASQKTTRTTLWTTRTTSWRIWISIRSNHFNTNPKQTKHLNKRLKAVYARFEDIFSMTLPKKPARLPPFSVKISREKWEVAKNRCPPHVQSAFEEVNIREATDVLSTTGIIEPSDAERYSPETSYNSPWLEILNWL